MNHTEKDFCKRLACALRHQFGSNCEVLLYDLQNADPLQAISLKENDTKNGIETEPPLPSFLQEMILSGKDNPTQVEDRVGFLCRTSDGRVLKCSALFIRDEQQQATGLFLLRFDITMLIAMEDLLGQVTEDTEKNTASKSATSMHVSDLLEELIQQSIHLVGRPVALMSRSDKIRAIRFLNDSGALLITKSGPRICKCFGISKFTLYSYLDEIKAEEI